MIITIVNFAKIPDEKVHRAIRAINRQVKEDFEPYWHMGGMLRLEGRAGPAPSKQGPQELRGDAIVYLWDKVDVDGALGYHAENNAGLPFGFVFTELSRELREDWSVTLSHESLELVGDANVNLLAAGPHPADPRKAVYHWYEMCDAVQAEVYEIDDVQVSNFVLPLYFTIGEQTGSRNDYLGRAYPQQNGTLRSFGVNPGGYVGFFDPETGRNETFSMKGDTEAERRLSLKRSAGATRRAVRYEEVAKRIRSPAK